MYVHMYVYMYVNAMCVYMHVSVYVHMCICVYVCIYAMHMCMHGCLDVCIHMYVCVHHPTEKPISEPVTILSLPNNKCASCALSTVTDQSNAFQHTHWPRSPTTTLSWFEYAWPREWYYLEVWPCWSRFVTMDVDFKTLILAAWKSVLH